MPRRCDAAFWSRSVLSRRKNVGRRRDRLVAVALVVKQCPHADGSVGADERLGLDPEGADLAAGEEHHVRRGALELVGARRACGDVDHR